ncbi:uncharacterized protein LOC132364443 [Balaenoptera ricei]|uniref:uncharacterized protein LOC132364443 n=1 Tax=Balaenoptera ricei TaxID=2746895 RepID=UPI0028BD9AAD|nr:uncharacterized protein LOC132364443 [Balaenoptera ricei]
MVSLQIWAICQHQVPSAAAENQAVKATRDDPSKKGQSPLKRTDLAPTRNLGLIADTSHTRPQCPISYRDLVPRLLTAETHEHKAGDSTINTHSHPTVGVFNYNARAKLQQREPWDLQAPKPIFAKSSPAGWYFCSSHELGLSYVITRATYTQAGQTGGKQLAGRGGCRRWTCPRTAPHRPAAQTARATPPRLPCRGRAPGTGEPLTRAEARRSPTDGSERAWRAARAAISLEASVRGSLRLPACRQKPTRGDAGRHRASPGQGRPRGGGGGVPQPPWAAPLCEHSPQPERKSHPRTTSSFPAESRKEKPDGLLALSVAGIPGIECQRTPAGRTSAGHVPPQTRPPQE